MHEQRISMREWVMIVLVALLCAMLLDILYDQLIVQPNVFTIRRLIFDMLIR